LPAPAPGPDVRLISGVPSYLWHHGCGPTAMGMVVGYWDGQGFGNMIPGSADWQGNRQAIEQAIASPGHVADYALYDGVNDAKWSQWPHADPYPDLSQLDPVAAHAPDCLADFAAVSFSSLGMKYGWSYFDRQGDALAAWTEGRGYDARIERSYCTTLYYFWLDLVYHIDCGRPAEFLVDTDADGRTDHFVTVIGYDATLDDRKYACYSTWDHDVHWFEYAKVRSGQYWGIYGATFLIPSPEPAGPALLIAGAGLLLRRRRRRDEFQLAWAAEGGPADSHGARRTSRTTGLGR